MKSAAALALLLLAGCVSDRVVLDAKWNAHRPPDHVDYHDGWVLGFVGRPTVDLARACLDRRPQAFERRRTLEDGLIMLYTLGVYAPVTSKVWCD